MVLCMRCRCGVVYIWCYVHVAYVALCTYGVVYMLYIWCYVHGVLCIGGFVYKSCMWCCTRVVHVVLCTRCVGGVVYMWYCVHVIHIVLYTCVNILCLLCSFCIMTCVFVALYTGCRCRCCVVH